MTGSGNSSRSDEQRAEIEERRQSQWDQFDVAGCKEQGGKVREVGIFRRPLCEFPYTDANKECTNSSQCEGKCLYTGDMDALPGEILGKCQSTNYIGGCFAQIDSNGSVLQVCAD